VALGQFFFIYLLQEQGLDIRRDLGYSLKDLGYRWSASYHYYHFNLEKAVEYSECNFLHPIDRHIA
jgi:hypothetical protein